MSKPDAKRVGKVELTGIALSEVVALYEGKYKHLLHDVADGAGRGREGEKDRWIYGLSNLWLYAEHDKLHPYIYDAVACIREPEQLIARVAFNVLKPHAQLKRHVDGPPYYDRYHLVLQGSYEYYQESTPDGGMTNYTFEVGNWYGPISYWLPHAVRNYEFERVTMLVDLEPIA